MSVGTRANQCLRLVRFYFYVQINPAGLNRSPFSRRLIPVSSPDTVVLFLETCERNLFLDSLWSGHLMVNMNSREPTSVSVFPTSILRNFLLSFL